MRFVASFWTLAHDPAYSHVIFWKNRNTVVIPDLYAPDLADAFSQYFKLSKVASLIRQLNLYKFSKERVNNKQGMEIKHRHFYRDFVPQDHEIPRIASEKPKYTSLVRSSTKKVAPVKVLPEVPETVSLEPEPFPFEIQ